MPDKDEANDETADSPSREEIAGALGVDPSDPKVDEALGAARVDQIIRDATREQREREAADRAAAAEKSQREAEQKARDNEYTVEYDDPFTSEHVVETHEKAKEFSDPRAALEAERVRLAMEEIAKGNTREKLETEGYGTTTTAKLEDGGSYTVEKIARPDGRIETRLTKVDADGDGTRTIVVKQGLFGEGGVKIVEEELDGGKVVDRDVVREEPGPDGKVPQPGPNAPPPPIVPEISQEDADAFVDAIRPDGPQTPGGQKILDDVAEQFGLDRPVAPGVPAQGVPTVPGAPASGVPSVPGAPVPSTQPAAPGLGVPGVPGVPSPGLPGTPPGSPPQTPPNRGHQQPGASPGQSAQPSNDPAASGRGQPGVPDPSDRNIGNDAPGNDAPGGAAAGAGPAAGSPGAGAPGAGAPGAGSTPGWSQAADDLGRGGSTPSAEPITSQGSRGSEPTGTPGSIGSVGTKPADIPAGTSPGSGSTGPGVGGAASDEPADEGGIVFGGTTFTNTPGQGTSAVVHTPQGNVLKTPNLQQQEGEEAKQADQKADEAEADDSDSDTEDSGTDDDAEESDTGGKADAETGWVDDDVAGNSGARVLDGSGLRLIGVAGGSTVDLRFTNTGDPNGPAVGIGPIVGGEISEPAHPGDETPQDETTTVQPGTLDETRLPGTVTNPGRPDSPANTPELDPSQLGSGGETGGDRDGGGGAAIDPSGQQHGGGIDMTQGAGLGAGPGGLEVNIERAGSAFEDHDLLAVDHVGHDFEVQGLAVQDFAVQDSEVQEFEVQEFEVQEFEVQEFERLDFQIQEVEVHDFTASLDGGGPDLGDEGLMFGSDDVLP